MRGCTLENFDIAVRRGDGFVTVELEGELDLTGATRLDAVVRPLTGQYDAPQVTFDCSRLTFVDSHGVRALVRIARIMRSTGRPTIRNASPLLRSMLELTEHDGLFELEDHATTDV